MKPIKIISCFLFLALSSSAHAATLSLSPSAKSVTTGDVFSVDILLDTGGQGIDGVDIQNLNFNPALLQVQGATTQGGVQINAGPLMPLTAVNSSDNAAGKITFSQLAEGGTAFNGSGTLASISFKALAAGAANVSFDFVSGSTLDTNVAAGGNDVLVSAIGGQYTISNPVPVSGGGGGGGGGTVISGGGGSSGATSTASSTTSQITAAHPDQCLVNDNGTYYLISGNKRQGITNPGMLYSYGYSFTQAETATDGDRALPAGDLLKPWNGALVKSPVDPTVYLVSGRQRHGFTSAGVFNGLGFKFSSVLVVTAPELEALPIGGTVSDPSARHLDGVNINDNGTIYWLGNGKRYPYPSLEVYNSWNIANDFSTVVPANGADKNIPTDHPVSRRSICGR